MYPQHEHISRVSFLVCLSAFTCTPVHSNSPITSADSLACIKGALTKQLSDLPLSKHVSHTCLTLSSNTCVFHTVFSTNLRAQPACAPKNWAVVPPPDADLKRQKETKSTFSVSWVAALRWFHPTAEGGPAPCESQVVCLRQRTSRLPQLSQLRASVTLNSATLQRTQHEGGQARRRGGHTGKCGETQFERTTATRSETARSWQCEELRCSALPCCLG